MFERDVTTEGVEGASITADRVRVATWNCFGAPGGFFGFFARKPHHPTRLCPDRIAQELAQFDVICIQENFLDVVAEFVEELADRLGMRVWHDRMLERVRARSMYGAGLAILSAQPLEVSLEIFPGKATGFDAYACKGYAVCELRTRGGTPYRMVNLHLQADDPKLAPQAFGRSRTSQLDSLLEGLDRLPDMPTVVCGDLNVTEGGDEYHDVLLPRMKPRGFVDVAHGLGLLTYAPGNNAMLAELDPDASDVRFDYIWTKDSDSRKIRAVSPPELLLDEPISFEPPREKPLFHSDHFGIGVELELVSPV